MKQHRLILLSITALLSACGNGTKFDNLVHRLPMAKTAMFLDQDVVARTATKSLERLMPFMQKDGIEDYVLSPATYSLAIAGLAAVSENFDHRAFGMIDAKADVNAFLTSWNYEDRDDNEYDRKYTFFRAAVLHQQIGPTYAFDKEKQKQVSTDYISTMVSTMENYRQDADAFFKEKIGLNLKVPDLNLEGDAVATYGVLKMKDYVPNGLPHAAKPFHFKNGLSNTDAYVFAEENLPATLPYYRGENYQAFKVHIRSTQLLIVLPDVDVALDQVDVTEAYVNLINSTNSANAFGYIPFFHNRVEGIDLSTSFHDVITGSEVYMSKLLQEEVFNDLVIDAVIQSNDFEFNQHGVAGESITVIPTCGMSMPEGDDPLNLSVDRPFYAIALKDNFPLFVNKICHPGA
ncbi:MAG: hypothetical protein ACOX3K_04610 [Bacilli bacterium]|jgi:hypothetical protein